MPLEIKNFYIKSKKLNERFEKHMLRRFNYEEKFEVNMYSFVYSLCNIVLQFVIYLKTLIKELKLIKNLIYFFLIELLRHEIFKLKLNIL